LSYRATGLRFDTTFLNSFEQLLQLRDRFLPGGCRTKSKGKRGEGKPAQQLGGLHAIRFLRLAFELANSNFNTGALQRVREFLGFRAAIVVGIGNLRLESFHALRRFER